MSKTVQLHDLYFNPYIEETTIRQRVVELGAELATKFSDKQPIFLAILNGSYVFAADLLRACEFDHEVSFIKLTSYEGTKTTGRITTQIGLKENLTDRHVILVEDIIDTGTTIHHFLPTLKKESPASISIVSFLSKPDALQFPLKIDYTGFEIPNKFVVGYGLDYNGLGRNLKSIYQLAMTKI
ncbi:MAG: hypoxanthine phosphoribosyltransferase [Bacteroidota bacterium]